MLSDYPKDYLTPEEAAYELDLTRTTIYNLLRNGKFPGFKVGKVWRIPKDSLEKMMYGQKQQASKKKIKNKNKI